MLKMRAMLYFIWEMQVFKLEQNFIFGSKCGHFSPPISIMLQVGTILILVLLNITES